LISVITTTWQLNLLLIRRAINRSDLPQRAPGIHMLAEEPPRNWAGGKSGVKPLLPPHGGYSSAAE